MHNRAVRRAKVYARSTNIVERLVNTLWSAKSLYVVERSLVGVAGAVEPRVHRSISYWPCCCLLVAGYLLAPAPTITDWSLYFCHRIGQLEVFGIGKMCYK